MFSATELPHLVVGACMEVHRWVGPGHTKETYTQCLARELQLREIVFQRDFALDFNYKGTSVTSASTMDFLVENALLLEVHATPDWSPFHKQRMISFLHLSGFETGFLINFHETDLRKGIKRLIVSSSDAAPGR